MKENLANTITFEGKLCQNLHIRQKTVSKLSLRKFCPKICIRRKKTSKRSCFTETFAIPSNSTKKKCQNRHIPWKPSPIPLNLTENYAKKLHQARNFVEVFTFHRKLHSGFDIQMYILRRTSPKSSHSTINFTVAFTFDGKRLQSLRFFFRKTPHKPSKSMNNFCKTITFDEKLWQYIYI